MESIKCEATGILVGERVENRHLRCLTLFARIMRHELASIFELIIGLGILSK